MDIFKIERFCCAILSLFSFSCCDKKAVFGDSKSVAINHDYDEINYAKIEYLDVFKQDEEQYYLYYYSLNCIHCAMLKNQIIDFALNSSIPIYFIQIEKDYGFVDDINKTIGAIDPLNAFAKMTPQLSFVNNHEIYYSLVGDDIELMLFTK